MERWHSKDFIMKEARYQAKIMAQIQKDGGVAINGNYTSNGEADLQCGIPVDGKLLHVAIEVKTEFDYHRVMGCIDKDYNVIRKAGLKSHEVLQMAKIRRNRKLGGLALVAYNYKQIMEYVNANEN